MRALTGARLFVIALVASTVFSLLGCGVITWRNVYVLKQPGADRELRVQEKCGLADCTVRVIVQKGWHSNQIARRRACNMNFADGVWDGTRAGVFIDASTCGTMQIAYDVGSNRDAPFSSIKEKLAEAIVKDYSVISSELGATRGDVFLWASRQGNGEVRRGIIAFRANRQP